MKKIRWIHVNSVLMPAAILLHWMKPRLALYIFFAICIWVVIGFFWVKREMKEIELPIPYDEPPPSHHRDQK